MRLGFHQGGSMAVWVFPGYACTGRWWASSSFGLLTFFSPAPQGAGGG